jgi:cell division protein FtsW
VNGEPRTVPSCGRPTPAPRGPKTRPPERESLRLEAAILALAALLTAFGVVMIYSASSTGLGLAHHDSTVFLRKQALWVTLALIVFSLARTTATETLRRHAKAIYVLAIVGLVLVLVPGIGENHHGARRWINVGGLRGEPSEFAKLALIVFAASWGATHEEILGRFKEGFLPAFGCVALAAGVTAIEPDMGTATFTAAIALAVLVVAGVRISHLALVATPGALGLALFAATKLQYIRARIEAFMDLDANADRTGYQLRQALIALGSGGPFGLGLGESRQKRLFLPDGHTDFIFALTGEELGFVGTAALLLLYGALVVLLVKAVQRSRDRFSFLLGTGLALAIGLQAALNVAVATASIPPKGIALPFVSYGGSSLFFCSAAIGLLARIAAEGRTCVAPPVNAQCPVPSA